MARAFRAIIARDGGDAADGTGFTTEDGRMFPAGAFTWRTPPLTVACMVDTDGGHDGAFVIGRADTITRDGDLVLATGELLDEGEGEDADERRNGILLIESGALNAVSVDPAGADVHYQCMEFDPEEGWCTEEVLVFDSYIIGGFTIVGVPAIDGTLIELDPATAETTQEPAAAAASAVEAQRDAVAASAAASLLNPPLAWFELPEPDELTPFTITDDGQVFGHLASWDQCHIGIPGTCVTAWRSPTAYSYFHLSGPVRATAADGTLVDVRVGPVAGSGGHYPTEGENARNWRAAAALYDDPSTCGAYVTCIDGELGPFVRGALRHGASAEQVAFLRNHPPSGDWRRIGGDMELVGVCSVNVPGFPVRQVALAASAAGVLEPFAAIVGLAHAGRCDECGAEHETTTASSARSLRAEAIDARLAAAESAVAALTDALGDDARAKFRARMRAQ